MSRLRKKGKVLICMVIILAVSILGVSGYRQYETRERARIITTPIKALTEEEKLEDMEYLYQVIAQNYPYLEVNKRLTGIDWTAQKENYLIKVRETTTDEDFLAALSSIMKDLNNGHTQMVTTKEEVESYRFLYYQMKQQGSWQGVLFDTLNEPEVLKRYQIEDKLPKNLKTKGQMGNMNQSVGILVNENVRAEDVIKGKVGYIKIKQMLNPWNIEGDKEILTNYMNRIKDYPAFIIDIRGNGGGDTSYWQNFLVPYLMKEPLSVTQYGLYRNGAVDDKILKAQGYPRYNRKKISESFLEKLPNLPSEISTSFTYFVHWETNLEPMKEGIKYAGNIYLLVDEGVYSAAEALAAFSKDSGFATLVGGRTGGDGIGVDPVFAVLPNSGYVVRFSLEMGISQDGTCNEECKTIPDYMVDNTRQRDFDKDACIEKVLELEQLNN